MSKLPLLIAAAVLILPAGVEAAPASLARPAFGNTVLTIDPDGRSRKLWLQPDGAWTGLSRRGLDLEGKWTVSGDKVCLTQSKPFLPGRVCDHFPAKVGQTLETKDPTGKAVQLKLVKGRVRE